MTRRHYTGKNKPARLILTHNEATILLHEIDNAIRFHGAKDHLATLRSVKTKLGVELARVSGATLRGSGR